MRPRFLCDQRFVDLPARGAGRYCSRCETLVVDLSRRSRAEARALAQQGVCGRVRLDERGEPIFREPPERRLGARALTVLGGLATAACASPAPDPFEPAEVSAPAAKSEPLEAAAAMRPLPVGASAETTQTRTGPVDLEPVARTTSRPTAAQRALTQQKHRPAAPVHSAPPPGNTPQEWMGDFFVAP